jgi:hypothetical protein
MGSIDQLNRSVSLESASSDFTRFVKAQAKQFLLAQQGFKSLDLLEIATAQKGASSRLREMCGISPAEIEQYKERIMDPVPDEVLQGRMLNKAGVAIGSITGWGSPLAPYAQASEAFLASLAPYSSFDRILNDNGFYPLPLRTRIAVASSAAVASSVLEAAGKPVSAMSFVQVQNPALKAIGQIVLSAELLRFTVPAADRLFELEMQKAVALATDSKFLQTVALAAGASHPSTGLSASAFLADLALALGSIQTDEASEAKRLYLVLPTAAYKTVLLLRDVGGMLVVNGKIGSINIIASSGTAHDGYLINAAAIGAASDLVTTEISRASDVEMQDNPTAGDFHLISMFQNNLILIRAERYFGATVLRSNGLATISGMV